MPANTPEGADKLDDSLQQPRPEEADVSAERIRDEAIVNHFEEIDRKVDGLENAHRDAFEALGKIKEQLIEQINEVEAKLEVEKRLADKQPRRVRSDNGVIERLVKFEDGTFEWRVIEVDESVYNSETPENVESDLSDSPAESEPVSIEKKLAEDQPRRVRSDNGVIERLVKFEDGTFEWRVTDFIDNADKTPSDYFASMVSDEIEKSPDGELSVVEAEVIDPSSELDLRAREEDAAFSPIEPDEIEGPAIDSEEIEPAATSEIIPPSELIEGLVLARDKYAELTAKSRNGILGHLLRNANRTGKIRSVIASFADRLNERTDQKINEARLAYEDAVNVIQDEITKQYEALVDDEARHTEEMQQAIRAAKTDVMLKTHFELESKIARERMQQSGKANGFVKWWVGRHGLGGKALKGLTVVGAGATVGFASSLVVPGVGTVLGGATGALIANHVTKRRANVEVGDGMTLAQQQSLEDVQTADKLRDAIDEDGTPKELNIQDLTNIVENRTGSEKAGNRARITSATAAGLAGGALGGFAADGTLSAISNAEAQPVEVIPDSAPVEAVKEFASTPEMIGSNFDVQSGSSFTQELLDFTNLNGHELSPQDAYDLHNELENTFGTYIVDAAGNPIETYTLNGDSAISSPGAGQWGPGVADHIQNWLTSRGL